MLKNINTSLSLLCIIYKVETITFNLRKTQIVSLQLNVMGSLKKVGICVNRQGSGFHSIMTQASRVQLITDYYYDQCSIFFPHSGFTLPEI